jgi:autotransporter-associated beta strand protein
MELPPWRGEMRALDEALRATLEKFSTYLVLPLSPNRLISNPGVSSMTPCVATRLIFVRTSTLRLAILPISFTLLLASTSPAWTASYTWVGGTSNWTTGGNWSPSGTAGSYATNNTDTAFFTGSGSLTPVLSNTGNFHLSQITFTPATAATSYSFSAATYVEIANGGGIAMNTGVSGTEDFTNFGTLRPDGASGGGTETFSNNGTGLLILPSILQANNSSGNARLVFAGASGSQIQIVGTISDRAATDHSCSVLVNGPVLLSLSNTASAFSGSQYNGGVAVTLRSGTVSMGYFANNGLVSSAGSGGSLDFGDATGTNSVGTIIYTGTSGNSTNKQFRMYQTSNGIINIPSPTGSLTLTTGIVQANGAGGRLTETGSGLLVLAGNNSYSGSTSIAGGTLQVGNGGATGTLGSGVVTNNSNLVFDVAANYSPPAISGSGLLTQNSTGRNCITLSTSNSFTGATSILGGAICVTGDTSLGTAPGSYVANQVTINGGLLMNASGSAVITAANRGIYLGPNSAYVGSQNQNGIGLYIGSVVSGGTLTVVNDVGTTVLANTANTYSGPTVIGDAGPYANINVGTAYLGVVKLADGGQPSSLGPSSSDASNLVFNTNSYGAATLVYLGSDDSTNRAFSMGSNAEIDASGSGPIAFTNPAPLTFINNGSYTLALGGNGTGTSTFSGAIVDNEFSPMTLAINGANWIVTNSNSFTGGTVLNGGTLTLISDSNIGGSTGTITFQGGALNIPGTTITNIDSHTVNWSSFNGSFIISAPTNVFTISQSISGTGSLGKGGPGTLSIAAAQFHSGATIVNGGTLQVAGDNYLSPYSTLTLSNNPGVTVDTTNHSQSIGGLAGGGTSGGNVLLGSGTLTVNQATNTTFAGTISGNGGLVMAGPGSLFLTGNHTYRGPTMASNGVLALGMNTSLASALVTVGDGAANSAALQLNGGATSATYGLSGGTAALVINGGSPVTGQGTFAFVDSGTVTNTLAVRSLTLGGAGGNPAVLSFNANNLGIDAIAVAGSLTVNPGGAIVNLTMLPNSYLGLGGPYDLLTFSSGSTFSGGLTFSNGSTTESIGPRVFNLHTTSTAEFVTVSAPPPPPVAYWSGAGDNSWSRFTALGNTNWLTSASGTDTMTLPGTITDVYFSANSNQNTSTTLDFSYTIKSLTFNDNTAFSGAVTIDTGTNSANSLTIGGSGGITMTANAGAATINAPLYVTAPQAWTNNSGQLLTIGGPLTCGSNQLTIAGSGTTVITGSSLSTGGGFAISAGSLAISAPMTLTGAQTWTNNSANPVNVSGNVTANGNALAITGTGTTLITGNVLDGSTSGTSLFIGGGGFVGLSGTNGYTGATTVNSGTLQISNVAAALNGPTSVNSGATLSLNVPTGATFPNSISGSGLVTVNTGTGATSVILSGSLSGFAGTIEVLSPGGKLALNQAASMPSAACTVNVDNGATLYLAGNETLAGSVNLSGGSTGETYGQLRVDNGAVVSGPVTLLADTTIGSFTGTGTISGPIGGNYGFTVTYDTSTSNRNQTIVLSGSNSYTGVTTVGGNPHTTLSVSTDQNLGNSSLISITAGVLLMQNGFSTGKNFSTNTGNLNLEVLSGGTATLTGNINSRNQLRPGGGGTLVLTGSQTLATGDLVLQEGTLLLAGADVLNASTATTAHLLGRGATGSSATLTIQDQAAFISTAASPVGFSFNTSNNNTTATLNIEGNGSLTAGTLTLLSQGSGNTSIVNLDGGTLSTAGFVHGAGSGTATVNLNGGLLQANASSTAFMTGLSHAYVENGALIDTNGFNITIGQSLQAAGTGGLTVTGSGMLMLLGANTYTGATTISNGTLQLGTGTLGQDGSLAGTSGVTDNSALVFDLAGTQTPAYSISGSGSLAMVGTGTLYLSGTNSYTGGTTVNDGELVLTSVAAVFDGSNLTVGTPGAFPAPIIPSSTGGSERTAGAFVAPVPEPGALALLVAGAAVAACLRKRRRAAGSRR